VVSTASLSGPAGRGHRALPLEGEQRELLRLLARGLSVRAAAARLHLSPRTAERRLSEARAALGAATNAEAVLRAGGVELTPRGEGVTPREFEVLELVAAGLRDDEIAARLGISPSTVATLVRSSMERLEARTRVEAVAKLAGLGDAAEPGADQRPPAGAGGTETALPQPTPDASACSDGSGSPRSSSSRQASPRSRLSQTRPSARPAKRRPSAATSA
jgi:DNA-binding CsgD family transcriptional regulator